MVVSKLESEIQMSLVNQLQSIRNEISHDWVSDQEKLGVSEYWEAIPDDIGAHLVGDCEEFARVACVKFRESGLPARLIYCVVPGEGGHLVCSVKGYILDNLNRWVEHFASINYMWVSASGLFPGEPWRLVNNR